MSAKMIDADKAIAVIAAEHVLLEGEFVGDLTVPVDGCLGVGHCALGALLFAAGMDDRALRRVGEPTEWRNDSESLPRALLFEHYGIRALHADAIMGENDNGHQDMSVRRAAVIDRVRTLAANQSAHAEEDAGACDKFDEPGSSDWDDDF